MRIAEAAIIMVPGLADMGADHWMARWQAKLSTARVVAPAASEAWRDALIAAVDAAERPVVLVVHAEGVREAVLCAPLFAIGKVKGAFFVAPFGLEDVSREPLPFPSAIVASRTHPAMTFDTAEDWAYAWGGRILDAGEAGAVDSASGHGPWPEGIMSFAGFLRNL